MSRPTPSESAPVDALEKLIEDYDCIVTDDVIIHGGSRKGADKLIAKVRAERAKLVEEVVWLLKKPSLHKEPYNPGEWCKRRDALLALLQTSGKAGR